METAFGGLYPVVVFAHRQKISVQRNHVFSVLLVFHRKIVVDLRQKFGARQIMLLARFYVLPKLAKRALRDGIKIDERRRGLANLKFTAEFQICDP